MHMKKIILLFSILFGLVIVYNWNSKNEEPALKKRLNKSARVGMGIGTAEDKFARFTESYKKLVDPVVKKVPAYMRQKEMAFVKTLPTAKAAKKEVDFKSRGPYNVGGRTRAFAIDVRNESVMLAGSVSGGLWKSTNGGESWYKVTSATQNLSITSILQDEREGHQNEWYFGTGELFGASQGESGAFYYGNGIFKSTDNGETWEVLPNTTSNINTDFQSEWQGIWRIAIDASNLKETEIYVATYARIHRSLDGGKTWSVVFGTGLSNQVSYFTDVALTSTGIVYVALSKENEIIANGNGARGGIWRSETGRGDFINILPADFPPSYNRIAIGIAPSDETQVYFAVANVDSLYGKKASTPTQSDEFNALWKYVYKSGDGSEDGGEWTSLTNHIYSGPNQFDDFYVQGGYDIMVAVKPDDPNTVFLGGTNLFRSTDGFSTPDNITYIGGYGIGTKLPLVEEYPNHHPDLHGAVFSRNNPNVLYSFHDGGISKTLNCMADEVEWETLNKGYISSQFYTLAIDQTDTNNIVMGGLQDNGTYFTNRDDSLANWTKPYGADGGYCAMPAGKDYFIVSTQKGRLIKVKTDIDGNPLEYQRFDPALPRSEFAFINAFALDPETNDNLYMPIGNQLWIREALSEIPLENNFDSTSVGWKIYPDSLKVTNRIFTSITPSLSNPSFRMYLGSNTSNVYRIDEINNEENTSFNNITGTNFPADAFVIDIAVNPHNGNKVMVAFSNYNIYSIYYSEDAGESWTKVAGNLEQFANGSGNGPSIRAINILAKADGNYQYFAGTSIGLFYTNELNGVETEWSLLAPNSIGNNIVTAIETREADGYIAVATHGNGVYTANTPKDKPFVAIENEPLIFQSYKAYPNPASTVFNLVFDLPLTKPITISIYNELGVQLLSESISPGKPQAKVSFKVGNFPKGIYYYQMETNGFTKGSSFVLQ